MLVLVVVLVLLWLLLCR